MKALTPLLVLALLAGCAGTQNHAVTRDTLGTMQGKSLVLVRRESPGFVAMTSGKGMFAVVGVGAAVSAGNKLVEENDIVDPAMDISRNLARNLATNHGLTLNGETPLSGSGDVDEIVALAGGSDYALDVVTNGWSYIYDGFKFDDYYVGYSSKLRLIDVHTGEVVSNGFCGYDAKEAGKETVSHDTLVADNAAYIKQELTDAMIHCVQEFEGNLFAAPAVASSD